jgi:methyltransferase (TIGR00027 family)
METGRASNTAFRVAMRRAIHQILDQPCVLVDPIAVPLLGPHFTFDREREMSPLARAFRAFMAARSRYAEDRLADAVASGVTQYAVLGAGLDTFAYRNPFPNLRIFEVDFPATQEWKRSLLVEAAIPVPAVSRLFRLTSNTKHWLRAWLNPASIWAPARSLVGWVSFPI